MVVSLLVNTNLVRLRNKMTSMLNKIVRFVMQPMICRFVCFVSSIVGLLCYALSSSFNHLFGNWNFLKVFLYCIFSLLICLAILFANMWQHSPSIRLRAHMVFFIFAITTVYSFFFDKANGKPDLYSLLSCASFAIMSFFLTKQVHMGFEVDLLHFFCGYLTLQLMKIKLLLVSVGIIFSYFLINLRFYSSNLTESGHLEQQIQDQHSIVIQVDADSEQTNIATESSESAPNMNSDAQQEDMDLGPVTHVNLSSQKGKSDSEYISLDDCKKELVKMSHKLNHVIWQQLGGPDVYYGIWKNFEENNEMSDIKNDLHKIVKKMVEAGFQTECIKVYKISRSKFLNKCLCRLGLHDVNLWDVDNENIGNLFRTFHTALAILFAHEIRLLNHFFAGLILESNILTKLEWKRVEIELWVKFMVLHSRFHSNFLPELYIGYEIHPLTRGVMNCIRHVCEDGDNIAYFDIHSIIQMLESTLDAKSRNFINPAFGYLFTLNNSRYIQLIARSKPLQLVLGNDWLQIQNSKVDQNITDYLRFTWNKVLNLMENNESMAANVAVESMRLFHLNFSDICSSVHFQFENKLKEKISRSLKKMLLPLYEKFIARFKDVVGENVANQHIKFGMSDLEDRLDGLFGERKSPKEPWKRAVEASGLRKRTVEPSRRP